MYKEFPAKDDSLKVTQETPGTLQSESRAFPSLNLFSVYWGSRPEGHKMEGILGDFVPLNMEVYAIPDTDLWALDVVLNALWKKSVGKPILIQDISKYTGWSQDKAGRVIRRSEKKGFVITKNTGRGLRINRATKKIYFGEAMI